MRTFAVVATALMVVTVGGCGGTTDAGPPPSPSTTPSGTPSASAPALPDAARENTKAGAVAFVRFYIDAFNHAQATGDVSTLRSLGAKGCVSCNAVVKAIRKTYGAGGHSTGGKWVVEGNDSHLSVNHTQAVYVVGHFEPSLNYANSTSGPDRLPGAQIAASFFLRYGNGWKVVRWTRA